MILKRRYTLNTTELLISKGFFSSIIYGGISLLILSLILILGIFIKEWINNELW